MHTLDWEALAEQSLTATPRPAGSPTTAAPPASSRTCVMFSTAPSPHPNQIIRGARTGDPVGHWDDTTHVLEDIQGRIRPDVPNMKAARRIMRDDWSWDVRLGFRTTPA